MYILNRLIYRIIIFLITETCEKQFRKTKEVVFFKYLQN